MSSKLRRHIYEHNTCCSMNEVIPDETTLSKGQNIEVHNYCNQESSENLFSGEDEDFHIDNFAAKLTVGEQKCQEEIEARNYGHGEEVVFEQQEFEQACPEPQVEGVLAMHEDPYPYTDYNMKIGLILGDIGGSEEMDTSEKDEPSPTALPADDPSPTSPANSEPDISHDDSSYSEPPSEVEAKSIRGSRSLNLRRVDLVQKKVYRVILTAIHQHFKHYHRRARSSNERILWPLYQDVLRIGRRRFHDRSLLKLLGEIFFLVFKSKAEEYIQDQDFFEDEEIPVILKATRQMKQHRSKGTKTARDFFRDRCQSVRLARILLSEDENFALTLHEGCSKFGDREHQFYEDILELN